MKHPTPVILAPQNLIDDSFAHLPEDEPLVEHATVPAFLRRVPHKWSMVDIDRFGKKVGMTADSIHLAYVSVIDRSLGLLRAFPVPMLKRIYELMSPQFGWPQVVDALPEGQAAEESQKKRAALRIQNTIAAHLRLMATDSVDAEVRSAAKIVLSAVERQVTNLRAELGDSTPAQAAA